MQEETYQGRTLGSDSILQNRFEIQRTLGRGGFSITYLAFDRHTGKQCVIKSLSLRYIDTFKAKELFEREAKVLANLDHPNIPCFIDLFTTDSPEGAQVYLVQEYKEGTNLQEMVREGKHFTEKEVIGIGLSITKILEYLQKFSPPIIHRDIKPSNILIADDGSIHLIDFGAVRDKVLHEPAFKAEGPTIIGTYGYMPLEQFEGRALPASDIYSLGATLIFLLSRKDPWEMEKEAMKLDFRPHVNVSSRCVNVLERMIDPDPEKRYRSAAELRKDLEALLVPTVTTKQKVSLWVPILLVAAGLIAAALYGIFRGRNVSVAPLKRIASTWIKEPSPESRMLRFGSSSMRHGGIVRSLAFSKDGKYVASASDDETVILWDVGTGKQIHQLDFWGEVSSVVFSPDGTRVAAAGRDNTVRVWNVQNGTPIARLLGPQGYSRYSPYHYPLAFSPDGKVIATQGLPQSIQIWDADTGAPLQTITGLPSKLEAIEFSADGKQVLAVCQTGEVRGWEWANSREVLSSKIPSAQAYSFSPDRKFVATSGYSNVNLYETASGKEIVSFYAKHGVFSFAFSPDGKLFAMGDGASIQIIEAETRNVKYTLQGHHAGVSALVFSPDGKKLFSGGFDNQLLAWNLENGSELISPQGHTAPIRTLAFSADGKTLVSGSEDSTTRQWNVTSGKEIMNRQWEAPVSWVRFLPGNKLAVAQQKGFRILDLKTNQENVAIPFQDGVRAVALTPDGTTLAIASETGIEVRSLSSGEKILAIKDESAQKSTGVAFSQDGKYLASAKNDQKAFLWDVATGKNIFTMSGANQYERSSTVFFSPDGKYLLTGGLATQFWSLEPEKKLQYYLWARGGELCTLSPDGKFLARKDLDDSRNIKLSRAVEENGHIVYQNLPSLKGHLGPIQALAFSPGGTMLASAGSDATILLWDLNQIESIIQPVPTASGSDAVVDLSFERIIAGPGIIPTRISPEANIQPFVDGKEKSAFRSLFQTEFPETQAIVLKDSYTIQFWFRLDKSHLKTKYVGLLKSELVHMDLRDGGKPHLFIMFPQQGGHSGIPLYEKTGALEADQWYHVGIVYDSSNQFIRIYWQGDLIHLQKEPNVSRHVGVLELGHAYDERPPAAMVMDELKIYPAARSSEEIAAAAGNEFPRDLSKPDIPIKVNDRIQIHEYPHFQVYQPTGDLSDVRIYDLDVSDGQVWAATNQGLLNYDTREKVWNFYGRNVRIPGEWASHIAAYNTVVVADLSSQTGTNSFRSTGTTLFDPSQRSWKVLEGSVWSYQKEKEGLWISTSRGAEFRNMKTGEVKQYTKENSGLRHNEVSQIKPWRDEVWFASRGDWVNNSVRFRNGGVSCLDRKTGKWKTYSQKDGLLQDYSVAVEADDKEVYVAHWDEEAGLSVMDRETGKWSVIKKSKNGIDLGGISLTIDGDILWIGQQQGFVKYDRTTGNAVWYYHKEGVPGNIVNRIVVEEDFVWVAVYGYDSTGIVRIPRK